MYELTVESQFDSAHNLRGYEGPCESLHGHTYRVQVRYRGPELNELGMLIDFKVLKAALNDIVSYLDHCYLNDLPEFSECNPTAEHIARFIFERMRASVGAGVAGSLVWETPTSCAGYWDG
jgi:6-pyruvoyltetrahydropterin/6-carboxytetrahydropterin synthase